MKNIDHSVWLCLFVGLSWALTGAGAIVSFAIWDNSRLSPMAEKYYYQMLSFVSLFGLSSGFLIVHAFSHRS